MQHSRWFVWSANGLLGVLLLTLVSSIEHSQPVSANSYLVGQQISWGDIFSVLRRGRKEQGGKGNLCLLVPANTDKPETMWHDRPLFVWKGFEQTIGLRQADSKTVFWRRSLSQPGTIVNQIQYTGKALQPGQTYELLLFSSPTAIDPVRWQVFTIMSAPNRASVTMALQTRTATLKRAGASEEAIAQQRAQVFSDRHLEADVLQEAYAVKQPSVVLKQLTTGIAQERCSPES